MIHFVQGPVSNVNYLRKWETCTKPVLVQEKFDVYSSQTFLLLPFSSLCSVMNCTSFSPNSYFKDLVLSLDIPANGDICCGLMQGELMRYSSFCSKFCHKIMPRNTAKNYNVLDISEQLVLFWQD